MALPTSISVVMLKILVKLLLCVLLIKAGTRAQMACLGVLLALIGGGTVVTGTIRQHGGAAPSLQGPVATGFGICLLVVGSVLVFLAARRPPKAVEGNQNCNAEHGAPPNGGPAAPSGSSEIGKGPPSVS